MARCEECVHYEICEIMHDQYGISKVHPSQCGYYRNAADVVEVRHGEWMDGFSRQICSVCLYRGCKAFNYCPNCGAKMERVEEDRKKKETDLTDRCGSCQWAKKIKGSSKGMFGCYIECLNPNKVWKRESSKRKQRTNPKCKHYKRREGDE